MKKRKFLISYTLLYIALAVAVWIYFHLAGKSLINTSDAYKQHINALMVYGKWIRGCFYQILHGDFSFQNYSFGIGYGADFYTSMQYYAVGDILNLPVAFIPTGAVYYYFQFLIVLRPFLAGLAFALLCKKRGEFDTPELLCGALSYAFCGTVMFIGMWNPFFVNAMIILPLMIYGADRIIDEGKYGVFTLSVALGAVTNFYFFYMCVLITIGYVIIRLILFRENALKKIGIFWGCGILGTAMGAAVFLPVVLAFMSNPRAGLSGHGVKAIYEADFYKELITNLITYIYKPMYDTELGFTFIAIPALVFVLLNFKKRLKDVLILAVLLIMLIVPFFGFAMTGFSYMINRWCFAAELFIAVKITEMVHELKEMELKKKLALVAGEVIYAALIFILGFGQDDLVKLQLLFLAIGTVLIFASELFKGDKKKIGNCILSYGMTCLVICAVAVNGYYANAEDKGNLPNGYLEETTADGFLTDYEATEVSAVLDVSQKSADDFFRYTGRNLVWNAGMPYGVSSTQFYFSLANGAISDYMNKLAINEMSDFSYYGLDDRMAPLAQAGASYYSLRYDNPEEEAYVPADYARKGNYFNFAVFEAQHPITLGYTVDNEIDADAFEDMTPVMRQEAFLTGVLRGRPADYEPVYAHRVLDYELTAGEGVTADNNSFDVSDSGQGITLNFAGDADAETYIYIKDLWCDTVSDMDNIYFVAYSGDRQVTNKYLSYKKPESQFYSGWHDYIVNMGSDAEGITRVEISFPEKGKYTAEEISVICEPNSFVLEKISELSSRSMYDVSLNLNPISRMTNKVTGYVTAEHDTNLVFQIPYEKGWKVTVDGENRRIFRANVMYFGVEIPEGVHEIKLTYHTPGLNIGIAISILAWILFVLLCVFKVRRR